MPSLVLVTKPKQQLRCWPGSKIYPITSFAQRVLTACVKFMRADQREQSAPQPVTQPYQALKVPSMIDRTGVHLCDFVQSKAFYTQALALKPEDWGAFVLDPDGHHLDAVRHWPGRA